MDTSISDTTQAWAEGFGRQSVMASPIVLPPASQPRQQYPSSSNRPNYTYSNQNDMMATQRLYRNNTLPVAANYDSIGSGIDLKVRQLLDQAQPSVAGSKYEYYTDANYTVGADGLSSPELSSSSPSLQDTTTAKSYSRNTRADIPSATGTVKQQNNQATHSQNEKRAAWLQTLAKNRFVLAALTGITVILILSIINPPFIRHRSTNKLYRTGPDVRKLLLYGGIASSIVIIAPYLLDQRK